LAKFVIPLLTETTYQGGAKILVERNTLILTLSQSTATDIPLVIIDSFELAVILDAERIQVARYRFLEVNSAINPSLLDGTKSKTILLDGISTFAVVNQGCTRLFIDIDRRDTLTINNSYTLSSHIRLHSRINTFKDRYFLFVERSSAIAFNTTSPFATSKVARETHIDNIVRNYTVVNDNH
jgi:hypothetical protein